MSDQITIPASYVGTPDATLTVDSYDGDGYTMALTAADGRIIAQASGFRPGASRDFGSEHPLHTASTFGAFLGAAVEALRYGSYEDPRTDPDSAASNWDVLADDADEWADALIMMALDESGNEIED